MSVTALEPVELHEVTTLAPVAMHEVTVLPPVEWNASLGQAGLWVGEGEPGLVIGATVGDEYLDTLTGDLYTLDPGL